MRLRLTVARLLFAGAVMLPLAAHGADLDDRRSPYAARAEQPYDDPRYRDLYADPPPRRAEPGYAEPRYRDDDRRYPPRAYRHDDYLEPMPVRPRFSEVPRREREPHCLPRREVHARLTSDGWSDFHDIAIYDRVAYVKAQRPSGQVFDLELDRCSGDIVSARRLYAPQQRPYAWGPPDHGRRY